MISKILNWWPIWFIRSFFCKHEYVFDRNLYGDAIIFYGFKRSHWYCKKCGKMQFREKLVYDDNGTPISDPETVKFVNELLNAEKKRNNH